MPENLWSTLFASVSCPTAAVSSLCRIFTFPHFAVYVAQEEEVVVLLLFSTYLVPMRGIHNGRYIIHTGGSSDGEYRSSPSPSLTFVYKLLSTLWQNAQARSSHLSDHTGGIPSSARSGKSVRPLAMTHGSSDNTKSR